MYLLALITSFDDSFVKVKNKWYLMVRVGLLMFWGKVRIN